MKWFLTSWTGGVLVRSIIIKIIIFTICFVILICIVGPSSLSVNNVDANDVWYSNWLTFNNCLTDSRSSSIWWCDCSGWRCHRNSKTKTEKNHPDNLCHLRVRAETRHCCKNCVSEIIMPRRITKSDMWGAIFH